MFKSEIRIKPKCQQTLLERKLISKSPSHFPVVSSRVCLSIFIRIQDYFSLSHGATSFLETHETLVCLPPTQQILSRIYSRKLLVTYSLKPNFLRDIRLLLIYSVSPSSCQSNNRSPPYGCPMPCMYYVDQYYLY